MLPQCQFVYPDGHRCGRIPGRNQSYCPAHSRPRPVAAPAPAPAPALPALPAPPEPDPLVSQPAFRREMIDWSNQCLQMSFPDLLLALGRTLCPVEACLIARRDLHTRAIFARAAIVVAAAVERASDLSRSPLPHPPAAPDGRRRNHFSNMALEACLTPPE